MAGWTQRSGVSAEEVTAAIDAHEVDESGHPVVDGSADGFERQEFHEWAKYGYGTGWSDGGDMTRGAGLFVEVAAGFAFYVDPVSPDIVNKLIWIQTSLAVPADQLSHIFISGDGDVSASSSHPDHESNVILGSVRTNGTDVTFISRHVVDLTQRGSDFHQLARDLIGGGVVEGFTATESGIGLKLNVTSGIFYVTENRYTFSPAPDPQVAVTWTYWYRDGSGGWVTVDNVDTIDNALFDDGSGTLAALAIGKFRADCVFVSSSGDGIEFHVVYGQAEFDFAAQAAQAALESAPDGLSDFAALFSRVTVQEGATNINRIEDASGGSVQTDIVSVFFPPFATNVAQTIGDHSSIKVNANADINFGFLIPDDFAELVSITLIGVPGAGSTGPGVDIDLDSDYATAGEAFATHSESDTTTVYDWTGLDGLISALVDLGVVLGSISANDLVGLFVDHNNIGAPVDYLGIFMLYRKQ